MQPFIICIAIAKNVGLKNEILPHWDPMGSNHDIFGIARRILLSALKKYTVLSYFCLISQTLKLLNVIVIES